MLDKRVIGLSFSFYLVVAGSIDNLDPFLNTGITFAYFLKLGKIPFSKELLMIAMRGIEVSFLIFFKIDVSMLLRSSAFIIELMRVCITTDQVRYFFWSCWCHEERFCIWVFKVIRKIPLCWWYVFLEFFAY